ncbi:DNA adenine methylase [Providencia alcalifaciens]|uniref:DNA adenine methylase n=1 Tax=Providencia alcalifaciens TaxID=126385 RepID=UPI00044C6522|nr:Dam family site-specific DNA-(adenine-N6)-methyltransferase [Providencia alcalifaciens]EUC93785.1 DNA adenine methylase [Providencia alcalifaciens PAL-2]CAG9412332.1 DNA adenine methylase [Providencia alcalifaciens]CAG9413301.1 DNA adenine methylase [Providencia alcalifaciens]CAG9413447.1 DNA adenine methylase [Providencia alcalifaciens]CAG9428658.1 DNA adenine methylase [Providencia alcalifaciens]
MAKLNKTILKWAGSKVRIMEQLRPHLPKTKRLVEPFAGSCAVMMNTDYEQYLIADINNDLMNLYTQIKCSVDLFIALSKAHFANGNNENMFYEKRDIFNIKFPTEHLLGEIVVLNDAALFLYLNRHGYNGLCRYNQKGKFNVPFGQNKTIYFPENEIIAFKIKAQKADIVNLVWQDTLSLVENNDGIYCDPPYMGGRESFTQYHTTGFSNTDHEALAIALKDINDNQGNPVTVSNSPEAKALYADLGFTIYEIEAPRTIAANGNRKTATEIIAVLSGNK